MHLRREFRQFTFDRRLNEKRLRAVLFRVAAELEKNPLPDAMRTRLESARIGLGQTQIFLSGRRRDLEAVAMAVQACFPNVAVTKASAPSTRRFRGERIAKDQTGQHKPSVEERAVAALGQPQRQSQAVLRDALRKTGRLPRVSSAGR